MTILSAVITLILVMDPFGGIPVFLSLLQHIPAKRRRIVILREMTIALCILALFLFFGKYILSGLRISEPALNISGGGDPLPHCPADLLVRGPADPAVCRSDSKAPGPSSDSGHRTVDGYDSYHHGGADAVERGAGVFALASGRLIDR